MRRFKILLTVLPETRTANDFLSPRRSARRGRLVGVPRCTLVLAALLGALAWNAPANNSVHTSWLWHLHQPIYWPDRRRQTAHGPGQFHLSSRTRAADQR